MNYVRRFVFVHYEDLLEIRFRKLEQVTDKLFVFMPGGIENIPVWLVKQMQKMGSDLDWVDLGDASRASASAIMGFHMGVVHEKVDLGVEFAILSDDPAVDALVEHVHTSGRTCVRVQQGATSERTAAPVDVEDSDTEDLDAEVDTDAHADQLDRLERSLSPGNGHSSAQQGRVNGKARNGSTRSVVRDRSRANLRSPLRSTATSEPGDDVSEETVQHLADDLVRKLIRSGNRPGDLSMLRSYVLLHSDEADAVRNVDAVIEHLAERGEIRVAEEGVQYNF